MSGGAKGKQAAASPLDALHAEWEAAWPHALEAWSRFTRLRPPALCRTTEAAKREGLTGSFAMIRLADQAIIVSLPGVVASGVDAFAAEVLAHEIGHHVLAPATLTDHVRTLARMRRALPTIEHQAPLVANLYTDILINDRLQRSAGLRLADVYRAIGAGAQPSAVWTLYMRIYEVLWRLERGALRGGRTDDRTEGDAWLAARLVRSYARDWIEGSGRFAAILFPYLLEDAESATAAKWHDTLRAGAGGEPAGLVEEEAGEREGARHPARDEDLDDDEAEPADAAPGGPVEGVPHQAATGQAREPFEYGEILRAAGMKITPHEAAVRYYRERALPHLVPFPSRRAPDASDPLPEGLEPWDLGQPIDDVDWLQSVALSPRVIPGLTTVQRVYGWTEGAEPRKIPLDLDLYVDSSGSMANPQQQLSYPALAGAIISLSALRAGARVQVTLWSGKRQFLTTQGFVRDERAVLEVLTGYIGGGTAFPIHILRDTYQARPPGARAAHILVVSDSGVDTMFDKDERGNSGWDVVPRALARAGGGGTLVLELPENWEALAIRHGAPLASIVKARAEQGWDVHRVASWEDVVAFAREFSRRTYTDDSSTRASSRR
jgi:hypothetical protein